ncbi:MAG: hypothetical protein GX640_17255 [Fibrobacter sp.]|nr:hypothetical protein [Fibrobacter sp.]
MGMKLWEEMSDTERTAEIFNRIKTDFETAQNEIQFKPVNYLLDRALDPLDPLSDFYKVILKNLGAQINGNAVKLPDHLELEIARESLRYDQSLRAPDTVPFFHTDNKKNYHITGDPIGKGGKVAKFNANLEAISILKTLESEKRKASSLEQMKLVLYTGWGGLSSVFKTDLDGPWLERQNLLKKLLTEQEYKSAARSTINAFYTSPEVIRAVWAGVSRMGYTGGPTLEPAAGTGLFFGLRPDSLPIEMHGIELDPISGKIAQQLYQTAYIHIAAYENIKIRKDQYNLIISNVPFGDDRPYEDKRNQTPGLDNRYAIHDFYFLKSLYGLKPGGVIAFVTSRYTMDKLDTEIRSKIADQADFIGAIRLPNSSFKEIADTEVVSDIVFLQKRPDLEPMSELTRSFISTGSITLTDSDGNRNDFAINRYFINHPEMVIGKHSLNGSMYSKNEYTVDFSGEDFESHLTSAIKRLPENIMSRIITHQTERIDNSLKAALSHIDKESLPAGSFIIGSDDLVYQKKFSSSNFELSELYENLTLNRDVIDRLKGMIRIRDSVKSAIDFYYSDQQSRVKAELFTLNSLYDTFRNSFGYLHSSKNTRVFLDDPDLSLLLSLENWNPKTKTGTKSDIFSGITFTKKESPVSVDSPVDAMVLSLSRFGSLNIPYMESLAGVDRNTLVQDLLTSGHIYQDPGDYLQGRATFHTADAYLSGNIREKLRFAESAAEENPQLFTRNVTNLQAVLPKFIAPEDISVRINSPIIGENYVKEFVSELLDAYRISIVHIPLTGKWELKCFSNSVLNHETYGTPRMGATDILNSILNGKAIRVYDRGSDPDDKPVLNELETSAAELKAEAIHNAFAQWIWKSTDRADDIATRYNELYNSHVERTYIHPERMINPDAEVFFHGCNFPYPMRPHQADAVWRNLQQNNTMLAHSVGAGKTLEIACSAMELRRLGLRNKPMIVCPDHMIGQWASEFRQAYPGAKLLIADDLNWNRENRRTFINKCATTDCDAILIRAESFKMIPLSSEYQIKFFSDKRDEYKSYLESVDSGSKRSRSVKDLEKAVKKYEDKIKELSDAHRDEGVIPFDKLGVDHLFIDEADIFKNLEYYTQLENVRGMGDPKGSERALDLFMKVRFIQNLGGGVTFATGTPISNTLVEAYTMQRFLQPESLKSNGLSSFDEWARQYAETVTQMELNNTGTGYVPTTRFSKIVNVPELLSSIRQCWDIQTAHSLEKHGILVPGVNLPSKTIINEAAPSSPLLKSYLKYLEYREENLSGKPGKGSDNVLSIITDGRKAAVDMRLINPHLPDDPDSKLNLAVNIIHKIYTQYENEKYTCAVFFDKPRSLDKDSKTVLFDGIHDIRDKLIARGVRPEEIGDVRKCTSYTDRQALFQKVKSGEVRVIFGSTENMGAGTNFQDLLKAIVHVDAPWRPRDIEQQNGRGYRPGNKTGELLIYNLVTKGSLDTGLWNVLQTKADSIRQIMDGSDKFTRQIEENYFSSVKELSIDNNLMKEAVELDHAIKKLQSQERSFHRDVSTAHRKIPEYESQLRNTVSQIANYEYDMAHRHPEAKGDAFTIELSGRAYDKRVDAGNIILAEASTLNLQAKSTGIKMEKKLGSYAGFSLSLVSAPGEVAVARIDAKISSLTHSIDIYSDSKNYGILTSLHHKLYKGIDADAAYLRSSVDHIHKNISSSKSLIGSSFPKSEEITGKRERYQEVMRLLDEEAKNKPKEHENPNTVPWAQLNSMSPDEIKSSVEQFQRAIGSFENLPANVFTSAHDIQSTVIEMHQVRLPNVIMDKLDASFSSGLLKPGPTCELIIDTINKVKDEYTWTGSDMLLFSKKSGIISQGDIYINRDSDNDFSAFCIVDPSDIKHPRYLGSESNLDALKQRSFQFLCSMAIRNTLNDTMAMAQSSSLAVSEPKKRYSPGMDI